MQRTVINGKLINMSRQFYASATFFALFALALTIYFKLNCVNLQARTPEGFGQQQHENHVIDEVQGSTQKLKSSARPEEPRHASVPNIYLEKKEMMTQEHEKDHASVNARDSVINGESELNLPQDHASINERNSLINLENELSFLRLSAALNCEHIFEKSQNNKSEFDHIWSEMENYVLVLDNLNKELKSKGLSQSRCFEGNSHKYAEESHVMAKLAR